MVTSGLLVVGTTVGFENAPLTILADQEIRLLGNASVTLVETRKTIWQEKNTNRVKRFGNTDFSLRAESHVSPFDNLAARNLNTLVMDAPTVGYLKKFLAPSRLDVCILYVDAKTEKGGV
jgi:hypothetical protein